VLAKVWTLLKPTTPDNKRIEAAVKLGTESTPYRYVIVALVQALARCGSRNDRQRQLREQLEDSLLHQLELGAADKRFDDVQVLSSGSRHQQPEVEILAEEQVAIPADMSDETRNKILIKSAISAIVQYLENRDPSALELPRPVQEAHRKATDVQWQIAAEFEAAINATLAGREIDSVSAKRSMITQIRQLLRQHALKVLCPHCGKGADLYVSPTGAVGGAIYYRHTLAGKRSNHGGKVALDPVELAPLAAISADGTVVYERPATSGR
jgi:hypothetical protein